MERHRYAASVVVEIALMAATATALSHEAEFFTGAVTGP
jgi:hypothetical protein